MIRLIASDIDGTLVEEGCSRLPEELFGIIEKLCERNILFAAASGRQYLGMRRLFGPVADKILFISENGANVISRGKELYASVIDPELVRQMWEYAHQFPECHLALSTVGAMYSTGEQDVEYRRLMQEGYHNDMVFADDMDTDALKVVKMSIYREGGIAPYVQEMEGRWKEKLNVAVAGKPWIDFINPGTDKGMALKLVQKRFGIKPEETMAFGDNHNDIGMVLAAGESYAVENARTAVKEAARYIVEDYSKKGVVRVLEDLLLRISQ